MATSLEQHRKGRGLRGALPEDRRARIAALALTAALALLLLGWLAAAIGGGSLFGGDSSEASAGLSPEWASLEPLLPLAPGLREMSDLKRSAAGGKSRVLGASTDGRGAIRLRALLRPGGSPGDPRASAPAAGRRLLRPARLDVAPRITRVVRSRRILRPLPTIGDLRTIVDRNVGGLPDGSGTGAPIPPIEVNIPPINPLPGGGLPGGGGGLPGRGGQLPGGGLPGPATTGAGSALNVSVGNLRADSSLDVLLVSSGARVLESYTFRDGDISGLSTQINLRSQLLTADALRDGEPLAHVAAAPLAGRQEAAAIRRIRSELQAAATRQAVGATDARAPASDNQAGQGQGDARQGRAGAAARASGPGSRRAAGGRGGARPSRAGAPRRSGSNRGSARRDRGHGSRAPGRSRARGSSPGRGRAEGRGNRHGHRKSKGQAKGRGKARGDD